MVHWFGYTRRFKENFVVKQKLGQGAFGSTYKCIEKATGHVYAVKELPKSSIQTEEDIESVEREVKILKTVSPSHDNIVTLFGVFEDEQGVYLLLELCTGGELFDVISEKGSFSEADAAHIVRQVLRVTAECHLNGIAHRDLKPENFLYTAPGSTTLKAIDFGLSEFFTPDTQFTKIVGSPYYVAPEVLRKKYGPAVDCWSVGVLVYVLLCGGPPFWGETDEDLFQSILNDDLDLETDPWPTVSEGAKDLIRRLLVRDPKLRLSASQALSHPWVREGGAAPNIPLCYDIVNSLARFSAQNALKRLFLSNFASNWEHKQELQALKDQFQAMDKDCSGRVSHWEFQAAIQNIRSGENQESVFSNTKIQQMLNSLDTNGDGIMDYQEFLAAVLLNHQMEQDAEWERNARRAFDVLDADGNGVLTVNELQVPLKMSSSEVMLMVKEIDNNFDGRIDMDEFKHVLKGTERRLSQEMFRPAQFVGMQALEDSTSQAAARSPLLNPMAPMIAAPVQQQLHTPQQLVQQEQQLPANSQKQPAALTAIHPSGPDGTISCDVSTASSISSKARIDALIAMAVKASWPGMVIIKKLLEELEELHNMLKVKRKQQELRRQQDEARAKLATLHAGAAAPAAVSAPGKQESADKPPQPSPRGSTETIAEGFAMQEAGMSSIPIFSHRLVDLMDD